VNLPVTLYDQAAGLTRSMTDRPDQRLGPVTERKALDRSQGSQTDICRTSPSSDIWILCNLQL